MNTREIAEQAAEVLTERAGIRPEVGLVCATAFAPCTDLLEDRVTIPFSDLPGFRPSAIDEHVNEVDVGTFGGHGVAAVKAKILPADGASWQEAGIPARTLALAGCRVLLYSANSGSMRDDVRPGSFLAFTDHINFSGINPLAHEREGGWRSPFLSMAELYDKDLTEAVCSVAKMARITLHSGVAGYWMGPSFETPAEIRLAQMAGCSVSSNSFFPEVIAAFHAGMRVVAFTFVSTMSAGIASPITQAAIRETSHRAHDDFRTLVRAAIPVLYS